MIKRIVTSISLPIIFIILLLGIFTFLVPPFQKPDEPVHFYWTMALLNGNDTCVQDEHSNHFPVSESVYTFPAKMSSNDIIMRPDAKFPIGVYKKQYPFIHDRTETGHISYCSLPILPYIPHVIGAFVSLPFDNLLITFYFMRISAVLFFLIVLFVSYRMLPGQYRKLFLWYASLPALIHQISAVSYDSVSLSLSLLLFCVFASFVVKKVLRLRHIIILSAVCVLTFFAKSGYVGLFIVPLILLFRLPAIAAKKGIILKSFFGLAILAGLLALTSLRDIVSQSIVSNQHILIVKDPWYFFSVLGRTLWEDQFKLITGLFGTFGWLEYGLPMGVLTFYIAAGSYVVYDYYKKGSMVLSRWECLFIFLCIGANIILQYYHFYLQETPLAYKTIIGFQGRYFLPFVPLFLFAGVEVFLHIRKDLFRNIACGGIYTILVGVIAATIFVRYYDFSKNFSNPDEFKDAIKENVIDVSSLGHIGINRERQFLYDVKIPNYKIGGFQMLIGNELSVSVPYRFSIKDRDCNKTLRSGYLDDIINASKKYLKGDQDIIYTQYIPITEIPRSPLCLTFTPIILPKQGGALELLGHSVPVVKFLYIAQ